MFAHVFVHQVLDEWFVTDVQPRMQGQCFVTRLADDFVRHEARTVHGASAPTADQRAVSLSP